MEPGPSETKHQRLSTGPHHPVPSPYQAPPIYPRPQEPPLPSTHHRPHDDHDHEPYPTALDRQLPPSAPQEPAMKRDPAEENPLQNYALLPTLAPQNPRNESFDVYRPPMMCPAVEIQEAASAKRKAQRASKACDRCRQHKVKCDEAKPCKNCQDKNMGCIYRDPLAKQPDKTRAEILELLSSLKDDMKKANHRLTRIEAWIERPKDENAEDHPGPYVMPGKKAIPPNHTALASLLLKWPSIDSMVRHLFPTDNCIDEFPIVQDILDQTMTDVGIGYAHTASPMPTGHAWGQVGSLECPFTIESKEGVLNIDSSLDWDPTNMWRFVQSFKDNILNMHPIIVPKELDAMVTTFLHALPKTAQRSNARATSQPIPTAPSISNAGLKRKRSTSRDAETYITSFRRVGRPYRSVQNALVLLALALGKICLHEGKIPDIHDTDVRSCNSLSVPNSAIVSSMQGSLPDSVPRLYGLPSPQENERIPASRGSYPQAAAPNIHSHERNLDVIPGLEYFALATDIIGSHNGGLSLDHVYAHVLAGLYHGQLGRVLDSWSYIALASRNLQLILQPSLGRFADMASKPLVHNERDTKLVFAFWTCLQLESDILAELPFPQSGILQYESQMPYPNLEFAVNHGFSKHVGHAYLAQVYLRKQLNQVHAELYDPKNSDIKPTEIVRRINQIQQMLKDSRDRWVPTCCRWSDDDPPANDILSAHVRAKYWDSQVVLYRPLLKLVIEREAASANIDLWMKNYAGLAIQALVESTRAFHGMDGSQRIIVTNVFGTAHAQWGNLLVLAACYQDPALNRFIDGNLLSGLFKRTISFFQMVAQPSSVLTSDLDILIGLAKDLEILQDEFVS